LVESKASQIIAGPVLVVFLSAAKTIQLVEAESPAMGVRTVAPRWVFGCLACEAK
jgi:hypothetical protein